MELQKTKNVYMLGTITQKKIMIALHYQCTEFPIYERFQSYNTRSFATGNQMLIPKI